jgi:hypothetical protein
MFTLATHPKRTFMLILCLCPEQYQRTLIPSWRRASEVHPRKRGSVLVYALSQMMCSLIESDYLRSTLSAEAPRTFGTMDWDWVVAETERVHSSP